MSAEETVVDVIDSRLASAELFAAAAAEVTSWPSVSAARARQVKWVANEYTRALSHAEHPLAADAGIRQVFTADPVGAYLRLARTGQLRVRKAADPAKGADHSEQIRLEVLKLLVTACGAEDFAELPPQPDPPRKAPVAKRPRSLLRSQLTELADSPDAATSQLRMLAIGAVVSDTEVRAGEMCARTIEDLSPTLEDLRVVRRPQGWSKAETFTELLTLSGLSRAALKRWLPERLRLLKRIGGTATALWVSLHGNHQDGQPVPAGTPLMPRSLARAVVDTNIEMTGQPSWEPLPTRMEQLRRGVKPTAVRAPAAPDAEKAAVLLDAVAARGRALAERARRTPPPSCRPASPYARRCAKHGRRASSTRCSCPSSPTRVCPTPPRSRPPDGSRCCSPRSIEAAAGAAPRGQQKRVPNLLSSTAAQRGVFPPEPLARPVSQPLAL
ncbi:hypothetical protein GT034_09345 [Streptomyces sp. SID2563]|uniref:hypothetical protein n=1 Tax=Streptomyces sp. SID2563 TaxID=2690255 RepID=UPI001369554C|nr:hypothetical protein [Streptomyces sp. SID2563]MYW08548.1 hypothetical protein [Streptomyces sp. SID2563]